MKNLSYHLNDGDVRFDGVQNFLHRWAPTTEQIVSVHNDVNCAIDNHGKCRHSSSDEPHSAISETYRRYVMVHVKYRNLFVLFSQNENYCFYQIY